MMMMAHLPSPPFLVVTRHLKTRLVCSIICSGGGEDRYCLRGIPRYRTVAHHVPYFGFAAAGTMGQYISKMNKSPAKWINESTWKECLQLSASIAAFAGLCSNIAVNGAFWNKFSASENPFTFLENEPRQADETNTPADGM